MRLKPEFLLGVGVGGVFVAGALVLASRAPHAKALPRAERSVDLTAEVDALKRELAAQRRLIALNASVAQQAVQARGAAAEPAHEAEPVADDEEASAEPALTPEARVEKRFAVVDGAFGKETRDAGWAHDTETQISRTLDGFDRVRRLESTCAATLCKLEVHADDVAGADDFSSRFLSELPFEGSAILRKVANAAGGTQLYVYLSRSGHRMPE